MRSVYFLPMVIADIAVGSYLIILSFLRQRYANAYFWIVYDGWLRYFS